MTIPFFSLIAATLYFGWLWHDRSATDRSEDGSLDRPVKKSNRSLEIHRPHLAPTGNWLTSPLQLTVATCANEGLKPSNRETAHDKNPAIQ